MMLSMQAYSRSQRIPLLFKLVLLTLLFQTVVISNAIKGLLLPYCLLLLLLAVDSITMSKRSTDVWRFLGVVAIAFILLLLLQQATNLLLSDFYLDIDDRLIVSDESPGDLIFRGSTFTQSAYFLVCLLYLGYALYFIKHSDSTAVIKYVRAGVLIYSLYGIFIYLGHILLSSNIDFLSNRLTGDGYQFGGNVQWVEFAGIALPRFVSLSGEPSMFAFAVVPFVIFFYYLREKILSFFLATLLILSTSATAIAGIVAFLILDMLFYRKSSGFVIFIVLMLTLIAFVKINFLIFIYEFVADKLGLMHISGVERYSIFMEAMKLFYTMDPINQLLGIGFGYVRTTDGFSTILINNGLLGFLFLVVLYVIPVIRLNSRKDNKIKALKVSNLVIFFMMLTSVPEFYNLHIYLFLALLWGEYLLGSNTRRCSGTACS